MTKNDLWSHIEINPEIMLGKPVVKGTRIPISVILDLLADGQTIKQIIDDYPDIKVEDIKAAMKFASLLTVFEEVPLQMHVPQYA